MTINRGWITPNGLRRYSSAALSSARALLEKELDSIKAAGTYKNERVITSKQAVSVQVQGQSRPLLNFCANNYLGLSVTNCLLYLSTLPRVMILNI